MESGFLHHYSEDPGIRRFMPRPVSADLGSPAMVWAIDERHAVNYWFPRECPRVIYRKCSEVSGDDGNRLPSFSSADTIITVESGWLESIRKARLYEYIFDSHGFQMKDETAGYYKSYETVEPVSVQPVGDLLERILARKDVELRFVPELHTLRNAVLASGIECFSIIRFRNAD